MIKRLYYLVLFVAYILLELVVSSVKVAVMVLRPRFRMRPGIVAIPMPGNTPLEIMLLANLITLTPGSLTLDVSIDRRFLYIHIIDMNSADEVREDVARQLERRLMRIL